MIPTDVRKRNEFKRQLKGNIVPVRSFVNKISLKYGKVISRIFFESN